MVVIFLNRIAALDTNLRALWQQAFIEMSRLLTVSIGRLNSCLTGVQVNKLKGWVLDFVLGKAQYDQPTPNRALASNSIGVLCELLDSTTIE